MSITPCLAISGNNLCRRARAIRRYALCSALLLLAACSSGGDSGPEVNSPLATPMALVVNQDDTTLTTLRLDGKHSPVISTLSLGPAQPDAIGGTIFSLGEWIFVTNTETNKVAAIDPIGGRAPILESFLDVNGPVRLGQRPTRIYRYPGDKEILLTMNEGDPVTGLDTVKPCPNGGSVTALHNSHLSAGGAKPHVTTTVCLSGTGEHLAAFSSPTAAAPNRQEIAFVSSKTTGIISLLLADPSFGVVRWSEVGPASIDLCDDAKEQSLGYPVGCDTGSSAYQTPNHSSPAGMFWSQATGKIYSYLAGYGTVVEIDPDTFSIIRKVDVMPPPPSHTLFHSVGITPNGQALFLVGEDRDSDQDHVFGTFGSIDLTAVGALSATEISFPRLRDIRPAHFQFTPDGVRIYMTQSNDVSGLSPTQAANLRKDLLLIFDPSFLSLVSELDLPTAEMHAMDLWITGPQGAGSAKGVVVTNATPGVNGTVSLIDAATNTITANIPVGRNPKQVTVYYYGLAASDNQATPNW
jgi:YVTN family beta-propeller protein